MAANKAKVYVLYDGICNLCVFLMLMYFSCQLLAFLNQELNNSTGRVLSSDAHSL